MAARSGWRGRMAHLKAAAKVGSLQILSDAKKRPSSVIYICLGQGSIALRVTGFHVRGEAYCLRRKGLASVSSDAGTAQADFLKDSQL